MKRAILILTAAVLLGSAAACRKENVPGPASAEPALPTASASSESGTPAASASPDRTPRENPLRAELSAEGLSCLSGRSDAAEVLMDLSEIQAENVRMRTQCARMADLTALPENMVLGEYALKAYITGVSVPSLPRCDETGAEITEAGLAAILENRNLAGVSAENPVRLGVTVTRTNLRRLPTQRRFLRTKERLYDAIQETELYVGMPVWVLHTSTDGAFFYVQSYFYRGWVSASDIAIAGNRTEWDAFAAPEPFVTVLRPLLQVDKVKCDMGVTLPLVSESPGQFEVLLPVRAEDGALQTRTVQISARDAFCGYLPYTYENFIVQAFAYVGTVYGWGGMDDGVDCSGFIAAVLRTFGFYIPRDTADQQYVLGRMTAFPEADPEGVAACLRQTKGPTAVYTDGHTLFYLGENGSGAVFIHAPSVGKTVRTSTRDLSEIRFINEIVKG